MNILFQLTHSILDNVTAHSNIIHLIKTVSHFFAVILLNNKINSLSLIRIGILHFGYMCLFFFFIQFKILFSHNMYYVIVCIYCISLLCHTHNDGP